MLVQVSNSYSSFNLASLAITIAGAIFQWPIGYLSDRFDRRLVIIITALLGSVFSFFCFFSVTVSPDFINLSSDWKIILQHITEHRLIFYIFISLYAGMCLPLFSLNLAYVNDFLPKEKFVAAGGGLQIIFGLGAMGGPVIASLLMYRYGTNGFFIHLFIFHMIIGLFGMYRITKRSYEDNPESTFTPLPRNITPLGMELDPTTGADITTNEKNE